MVTPVQARIIIHEWMFATTPALECGSKAIDALRDLASQVEDLQVDAARYRWIRSQHWSDGGIAVVFDPKNAIKLGYDCPSLDRLDEAIDNEMKGQP